MNASPSRCSSGPQNRIGIRLEPACASMSATCARSTLLGSRSSTPSRGLDSVTWTPCSSSRPVTTVTSRICGTFSRRLGSSPSSAATIALETKFLAPRTVIVPARGVPPWTVRTSVTATILAYTGRPTRQGRCGRRRGANSRACRGSPAESARRSRTAREVSGRRVRRRRSDGPSLGAGPRPVAARLRGGAGAGGVLPRRRVVAAFAAVVFVAGVVVAAVFASPRSSSRSSSFRRWPSSRSPSSRPVVFPAAVFLGGRAYPAARRPLVAAYFAAGRASSSGTGGPPRTGRSAGGTLRPVARSAGRGRAAVRAAPAAERRGARRAVVAVSPSAGSKAAKSVSVGSASTPSAHGAASMSSGAFVAPLAQIRHRGGRRGPGGGRRRGRARPSRGPWRRPCRRARAPARPARRWPPPPPARSTPAPPTTAGLPSSRRPPLPRNRRPATRRTVCPRPPPVHGSDHGPDCRGRGSASAPGEHVEPHVVLVVAAVVPPQPLAPRRQAGRGEGVAPLGCDSGQVRGEDLAAQPTLERGGVRERAAAAGPAGPGGRRTRPPPGAPR